MDAMSLDATNPFAAPSTLPFELPDFTTIRTEHYRPAIEAGMAEQLAQLEVIAADPRPPTVANVIEAWERSGQLLARSLSAFYTKQPADTDDELDEVEAALAPELAAHRDAVYLDRARYERVAALAARGESGAVPLDPASAYWLERRLLAFERLGVNLEPADQMRLRKLNSRIAELQSAFGREALAGRNAGAVLVINRAELDGFSETQIEGARERARDTGHAEGWLIELDNTSGQRSLEVLKNRDLRHRIHLAAVTRGLGGDHDTRGIIVELARLRAERARLLGFATHADYVAADGCARSGRAVWELLTTMAPAAVANARREADEMEPVWRRIEPVEPMAAWDWQYVSELLRTELYALDATVLRPYLELERVLHEGVFAAAHELYGVTFTERPELVGYHLEVRLFEVNEADGAAVGLFAADFYARPGKQGGAWMNNLVDQNSLLGQLPVVTNNANLVKPPAGRPTLMTWDDVITLFHEFGHALHGLLSEVRYPSQSGTNTPRDFVEYPSQVNEIWALDASLLGRYAVHSETGEPLPPEWVETLRGATLFQQGFKTTEYLAAALLDQVWHTTALEDLPVDADGVEAFERRALASVGLDYALVPPRYRSGYFRHVFEGGYDAAYYAYLFSEVMDADTVAFLTANGGLTRENGERFRRLLLAPGGSLDPMSTYRTYRGQDPDLRHLLTRRGL